MREGRKAFLLGAAALAILGLVCALVVVTTGILDVAAVRHPLADRVLAYASTRSIARHAPRERNPLAGDAAAVRRGLEHYAAMCAACHGGPGVEPREFAAGLHPPAPDLASPQIQAFTDGMLYRTVAEGIGSTGMPAFGPTHGRDELWSIVAFVRRLPALTTEEKDQLARAAAPHREQGVTEREGAPAGDHAEPAAAATPPEGQRVHRISISGFKFDPAELEARVGDAVEWHNADFTAHTATANDHAFDTGRIEPGQSRRIVVTKPGRLPYFCRYHLAMKGTLTVR